MSCCYIKQEIVMINNLKVKFNEFETIYNLGEWNNLAHFL